MASMMDLRINNNSIWALPTDANVESSIQATGNILECNSFGISVGNCTCANNLTYVVVRSQWCRQLMNIIVSALRLMSGFDMCHAYVVSYVV